MFKSVFAERFAGAGKRLYQRALVFGGNHMKSVIIGMLLLIVGVTLPAFSQEERHEESAKPAQHEEQAKPAAKQEQARPQKQEQQAKPAKQEQAKPEKQQQQAKPQKQEQQAKHQEQNQQKQAQQQSKGQQQQEKKQQQQQTRTQQNQQHQQQQAAGHAQQSQAQYARNGQKDRYGHEYNESHFGRNHHSRFEASGGREYNGRREYSYGGYWFYAGAYPAWFYQQDVYFIMGADGLWYAVAYGDPSLTFQVYIE
jgi:type IV secretory pathway VirB10-like protein